MDASYAWHPGACGISPIWARPVPIYPDELLSSWLVRAALAQGCDPLVLTGSVWPKWRAWTLDVDRSVTAERLAVLARLSGIPTDIFEAATLQPATNQICGAPPSRMGTWPWILSLGARNTRRRGGLQYCPECLATDHVPYYRIQWRFAWHTGCERHGRSLLDRCGHCSASLEPHRLLATDGHITTCATCRQDLRAATGGTWPAAVREFQLTADEVLVEQVGIGLAHPLAASEWFDLAAYIASLLRQALRFESGSLRAMVESIISTPLPDLLFPDSGGIEQMRIFERQALLGVVAHVMAVTAEALQADCVSYGLTHQGLCRARRTLPAVVSKLSLALKNSPQEKRRTPRNPKETGPRPRHVVKRMMARLERRARMVTR